MGIADTKSIAIDELGLTSPPAAITQARALLLEYGRFVITQPGAAQFCFGSLEKEAERLPLSYLEQGGGCMMARAAGQPAGFVAWRELPATVKSDAATAWELKRLWVRPEARNLGLGRLLTEAAIDRARTGGRRSIYLDTAPESMGAAYRMYLAMGFIPCEKYNDNPVEGLVYLVKHL
ncbi:MAG TPA: GNAT family N-acetyltransferase [Terracidiphilus sp.]|jgi:ribosomal protein S18 acetylase RimI-like enzyme